ncbi:MAG: cytochrome c1, partial [Bacteroidia bacterium]|nr:cytochrome c1 [Methylotenera sp.]
MKTKNIIKNVLLVLTLLSIFVSSQQIFANEDVHLDKAPIDVSNHESLQRGARTFTNYCLNCHSANYMRYNRLLEIGLTEQQIKENLIFTGDKVGDPMKVSINKKEAKTWFGVA